MTDKIFKFVVIAAACLFIYQNYSTYRERVKNQEQAKIDNAQKLINETIQKAITQ